MIEEIIKEIEKMSGVYSGYEIFADWVKISAICISNGSDVNHGKTWDLRENEYLEIAKKHGNEAMKKFSMMLGMLAAALEKEMEDVLGKIYMSAGLGSKQTGQFFTPYHISKLISDAVQDKGKNRIELYEPSTGGGGMIIAAARTLKEQGKDYQRLLYVTAKDMDWKGVYMTYVQLSLLGINATVIQGDSLAGQKPTAEQIYYTPVRKGMVF